MENRPINFTVSSALSGQLNVTNEPMYFVAHGENVHAQSVFCETCSGAADGAAIQSYRQLRQHAWIDLPGQEQCDRPGVSILDSSNVVLGITLVRDSHLARETKSQDNVFRNSEPVQAKTQDVCQAGRDGLQLTVRRDPVQFFLPGQRLESLGHWYLIWRDVLRSRHDLHRAVDSFINLPRIDQCH